MKHPIPVKTLSYEEIKHKSDDREKQKGHQPCNCGCGVFPLNKYDGNSKNDVNYEYYWHKEVMNNEDQVMYHGCHILVLVH